MSITTEKTVVVIPDRTTRVIIEKGLNQTPSLMTVDEKVIDGICIPTGNMYVQFDEANPLHVALQTALSAVVAEMRVKRDTAPVVIGPVVEVIEPDSSVTE